TARIDAIAIGRQFAPAHADSGRLAKLGIELAGGVARSPRHVRRAFVKLAAIGRIGEPVAAVGMGHHVVWRVELLAVERIGQHGGRAVELIAHDTARQVFARKLPALEVEGVAVAIVRRAAEEAHPSVILEPAQLAVVGDVAPYKVATLAIPRWT